MANSQEQGSPTEEENDGGETVDEKETTETSDDSSEKDWEEIAKDQRKRAEKAESTVDKLQEALSDDTESEQDDSTNSESDDSSDFDRIYNVTKKVGQLADDEFNEVKSRAKELGVSAEKFLDSKAGEEYLKSYRKDKQVEESTPAPSSRGVTVGDKSFEDMSNEERKANWDKIVNPQSGGNSVE